MRRHLLRLGLTVVLTAIALPLLSLSGRSADAPRVVNVTTDSQPGWTPSVELEQQARAAVLAYLAALDGGKYDEAYAMIADLNRTGQPLPAFTERMRAFNARAGHATERSITTVTWTKDSPNAPLPGVFVAFDLVSHFANIDRHCGYLMMYQPPSGGAFKVMREENNYFTNADAADVAKKSGAAAVDRAWAAVSANCPGYQAPLPEASSPTTGYPSVAAALAGLHAKSGVVFREDHGWTIAEDEADMTVWSFAPVGDPAYPAVVKRHLHTKDGATYVDMSVHCEASKSACDNLVRSFNQLNAKIGADLQELH